MFLQMPEPETLLQLRGSKNLAAKVIAEAAGYRTPEGVWNTIRTLTAQGMISSEGTGIMDVLAIFIGALGNSAAKAPAAVHLFLDKVRLVNNHDAPDPQRHLKAQDDTPLGVFLASILLQGAQEIRRSNWTLSVMGNPASAEITCSASPARRVFLFMSPDCMEAKPQVRTAKIVPAEVLARLSDLVLHGQGNAKGQDA